MKKNKWIMLVLVASISVAATGFAGMAYDLTTERETSPEQFQKKPWREANINGDMILTWEEELIWQYNYQKKKSKKT